ncbi:hypothetical protein [Bacillus sp. TH50]|nr:hypothetical protein [Bacillus sp. TH50]
MIFNPYLQNQIDANKQDNQVSKTQAWKDRMNKSYSAIESVNTNFILNQK